MLFRMGDMRKNNDGNKSRLSPSPTNKGSSRFNKTFNDNEQNKSLNLANS